MKWYFAIIMLLLSIIMPYMYIYIYWLVVPSEKYDFVSWGDDIPNMMGKS